MDVEGHPVYSFRLESELQRYSRICNHSIRRSFERRTQNLPEGDRLKHIHKETLPQLGLNRSEKEKGCPGNMTSMSEDKSVEDTDCSQSKKQVIQEGSSHDENYCDHPHCVVLTARMKTLEKQLLDVKREAEMYKRMVQRANLLNSFTLQSSPGESLYSPRKSDMPQTPTKADELRPPLGNPAPFNVDLALGDEFNVQAQDQARVAEGGKVGEENHNNSRELQNGLHNERKRKGAECTLPCEKLAKHDETFEGSQQLQRQSQQQQLQEELQQSPPQQPQQILHQSLQQQLQQEPQQEAHQPQQQLQQQPQQEVHQPQQQPQQELLQPLQPQEQPQEQQPQLQSQQGPNGASSFENTGSDVARVEQPLVVQPNSENETREQQLQVFSSSSSSSSAESLHAGCISPPQNQHHLAPPQHMTPPVHSVLVVKPTESTPQALLSGNTECVEEHCVEPGNRTRGDGPNGGCNSGEETLQDRTIESVGDHLATAEVVESSQKATSESPAVIQPDPRSMFPSTTDTSTTSPAFVNGLHGNSVQPPPVSLPASIGSGGNMWATQSPSNAGKPDSVVASGLSNGSTLAEQRHGGDRSVGSTAATTGEGEWDLSTLLINLPIRMLRIGSFWLQPVDCFKLTIQGVQMTVTHNSWGEKCLLLNIGCGELQHVLCHLGPVNPCLFLDISQSCAERLGQALVEQQPIRTNFTAGQRQRKIMIVVEKLDQGDTKKYIRSLLTHIQSELNITAFFQELNSNDANQWIGALSRDVNVPPPPQNVYHPAGQHYPRLMGRGGHQVPAQRMRRGTGWRMTGQRGPRGPPPVIEVPDNTEDRGFEKRLVLLQPKNGRVKPQLLEVKSNCDWSAVRTRIPAVMTRLLGEQRRYPDLIQVKLENFIIKILPKPPQQTKVPKDLVPKLKAYFVHPISIRITRQPVEAPVPRRSHSGGRNKPSVLVDLTEGEEPTQTPSEEPMAELPLESVRSVEPAVSETSSISGDSLLGDNAYEVATPTEGVDSVAGGSGNSGKTTPEQSSTEPAISPSVPLSSPLQQETHISSTEEPSWVTEHRQSTERSDQQTPPT